MRRRRRALGVFIFAGGFTEGVKQHFDVLAHLEEGSFGVKTSELNHPEIPVYTDPAEWPEEFAYEVDFVYANPPCAPWSMAGGAVDGKRGLTNDDPRVRCVELTYDVLERVRPRVWAWESVARVAKAGRPTIDRLAERAARLGYACTITLLDALDCGVPQYRRRCFTLLHDIELDLQPPTAEHRVVGDVLKDGIDFDPEVDLARMSDAEAAVIDHVQQGGSLRDTFNRLHDIDSIVNEPGKKVKGRPSFIRRRLDWDRPSFTVVGGPHLFHPEERRLLSAPEVAAICGYPAGYEFVGSTGNKYAQIAKAVLPPVGDWLAGNVLRAVELGKPVKHLTTTVVDTKH